MEKPQYGVNNNGVIIIDDDSPVKKDNNNVSQIFVNKKKPKKKKKKKTIKSVFDGRISSNRKTSLYRKCRNSPRKKTIPTMSYFLNERAEKICGFLIIHMKDKYDNKWIPIRNGGAYSIGRKIENQIIIRDKFVSRYHAIINCKNNKVYIQALSEVNPTEVNGNLLKEKRHYVLTTNDIIKIVTHEIQYCAKVEDYWGKSKTGLYYDKLMLRHQDPSGFHPERPKRIELIMDTIRENKLDRHCLNFQGRKATEDELLLCHSKSYIDSVLKKQFKRTSDTFYNRYTPDAALLSCGGVVEMVEKVLKKELENGFCIIRPPGHHADESSANGFCFFNNVAVAARVASVKYGKKVLIIDWDVHHGNGTNNIFEKDNQVFYFSMHRYGHDFYPHTGAIDDLGAGKGVGFASNVPVPFSYSDQDMINTFLKLLLPIAFEWKPELIIVSAGFDCVIGDTLGNCFVRPECFGTLTFLLKSVTPNLVLALEGGYNCRQTTKCVLECLKVLLGKNPTPNTNTKNVSEVMNYIIDLSQEQQKDYWDCFKTYKTLSKNVISYQINPLFIPPELNEKEVELRKRFKEYIPKKKKRIINHNVHPPKKKRRIMKEAKKLAQKSMRDLQENNQ